MADEISTVLRSAETRDRHRRDDVMTTSTETHREAIRMSQAERVAKTVDHQDAADRLRQAAHHRARRHQDAGDATHPRHLQHRADGEGATMIARNLENAATRAGETKAAIRASDLALALHLVDAAHVRLDDATTSPQDVRARRHRSALVVLPDPARALRPARSEPHLPQTT